MRTYIRNFLLTLRIEHTWRRILRLRKRLAFQYEREGDLSSIAFLSLYHRLDRLCSRVTVLEQKYARLNNPYKAELPRVTAALV